MTDPDATPAKKFDAWLAEHEAAGRTRRPGVARWQRLRNDAEAYLALAGILAAAAAIGWWKGLIP